MKTQVIIIHGGDTFETNEQYLDFLRNFEIDIERYKGNKRDWKQNLQQELGEDYEVYTPQMPSKTNAKFDEWKIWFEKLIPFLHDDVVLVGHSLGASFLIKYLSQNKFPKSIAGLFLVSATFEKDTDGYTLASFALPKILNVQTDTVYVYHSTDDPVVPFSDCEKIKEEIPQAQLRVFEDRKHFNQVQFPELIHDVVGI